MWVGCGGDDTTTPTVDSGTDTSTQTDSGTDTGGNTDGGTTDGATTDGPVTTDAGVPTNCANYCALVQATCAPNGPNGQYVDQATCEAMCAKFPAGDAGATSGNSFACRAYHVSVAAQNAGNATIHCPHAGPYGFGGCGSETENFCKLYTGFCTTDVSYGLNCPTNFAAVNDTTDGGSFLPGTGPRDCREYHLENAYKAGGGGGGHCDHASKDGGGVCN
ncbi:hypothetical protein BH09MYX1_BH09MYX1_15440 [soil metagenome]